MTHEKFDRTYEMFEQIKLVTNEIDDLIDISVHNGDDYLDQIIDLKTLVRELTKEIGNDLRQGVDGPDAEEYA